MASKIFTTLGTVLLIAALSLWGYNLWEDQQAGKASSDRLSELVQQLPTESGLMLDLDIPEAPTEVVDTEMKEVELDGNAYIGYLSIPSLKLELPVISQWSYEKLKIAPCRYYGTMKGEDLVILAHNYGQHFGNISRLEAGDEITFTDMEGTVYRYEVSLQETLDPMAVEEMISGEYPLTLFTCTYGGENRIVVRCTRRSDSHG